MSTSVTPSPCLSAPPPSGGTNETFPNTAWPAMVLVLTLRALPETRGASCSSGRNRVVRSRKRPSNAGGSSTCTGALLVVASRRRLTGRASGDERARVSGALVVCAETRKLLSEEGVLDEREMFACRALLECVSARRTARCAVLTRWLSSGILPSADPDGRCEHVRTS
jgi:hypothetical protein